MLVVESRSVGPAARERIRKIAVLRALFLGDLLLAIPALRSLRAGFPEAEMTLISLPWAQALVKNLSVYVDRFVEFGGYRGLTDTALDPDRSQRFIDDQRAYGYDMVIQMHGAGGQSNPCARALGARRTAGFYLGQRPDYLEPAVPYPEHLPEVLRCLELPRALGCPDLGPRLAFPILPGDRQEADRLLDPVLGSRPLIGIHAGAKSTIRRWPARNFALLAEILTRQHGATIVLTGGEQEEDFETLGRPIDAPVLDLTGQTPLGTLAAVLASLDLLVVNNTGPAHLAEAVGTTTVRIFDLDETWRWAPLDETRHRVVRGVALDRPRHDGRWWRWPEPRDVLRAVDKALSHASVGERIAHATG